MEAIIFDMDGVLSDSQLWYDEAVVEILRGCGISGVTREVSEEFYGISSSETWQALRERYSLSASVDELVGLEEKYMDARNERGEVLPVPFAFEMMKSLHKSGLKIAVATSNFSARAWSLLRQNAAEALVGAVVSVEDVERAKPAPDIFLLAAERLGVPPQKCVVIEDAPSGVKAAKAAGMSVIQYAQPDRAQFGPCGADAVLTSFEGITKEKIIEKLSKS